MKHLLIPNNMINYENLYKKFEINTGRGIEGANSADEDNEN